jgi:hypothetical protein
VTIHSERGPSANERLRAPVHEPHDLRGAAAVGREPHGALAVDHVQRAGGGPGDVLDVADAERAEVLPGVLGAHRPRGGDGDEPAVAPGVGREVGDRSGRLVGVEGGAAVARDQQQVANEVVGVQAIAARAQHVEVGDAVERRGLP